MIAKLFSLILTFCIFFVNPLLYAQNKTIRANKFKPYRIDPSSTVEQELYQSITNEIQKDSFVIITTEATPTYIIDGYYTRNENGNLDIYAQVYDGESGYIIDSVKVTDLISDKELSEIRLDKEEMKEQDSKRYISISKKIHLSIKGNPNKKERRERIEENLLNTPLAKEKDFKLKKEDIEKASKEVFDLLKGEQMVITATRSKRKINELPITIQAISKEEIQNYNYLSLAEAMKFQPGIIPNEVGNAEYGQGFFQRGLTGNTYTKVLLNGLPIVPTTSFAFGFNEHLFLMHAESIEVVSGPASAIYGADAFAGVINIITTPKKENNVNTKLFVGDYGYLHTNFTATATGTILDQTITATTYGIKSRRLDQPTKEGYLDDPLTVYKYYQKDNGFGSPYMPMGNLPSQNTSYGLALNYGNWNIFFDDMKRSGNSSVEQVPNLYNYHNTAALWSENYTRLAAKHSYNLEKISFHTNLSYLQYRLDPDSNYSMTIYKNPLYKYAASDDALAEEIIVYNPTKELEFVAGATAQFSGAFPKTSDLRFPFDSNFYKPYSKKLPSPDPDFGYFGYNPIRYKNIAGFVQTSYTTKDFSLTAGVRYDEQSLYGKSINPRIAGLYNIFNATSIRLSYSEGFRGPPPNIAFGSIAFGSKQEGIYYLTVPNKDLKPEKLRVYEFGIRHKFSEKVSSELIAYRNNFIDKFGNGNIPKDPIQYPNATFQTHLPITDNLGTAVLNSADLIVKMQNIYEPIQLNISTYFTVSKGNEFLHPPPQNDASPFETFLEEVLFPNKNKINNYRGVPHYYAKARLSFVLFNQLFVGIDYMHSDGFYARGIQSASQYKNAEFNPTYNPFFLSQKVNGYNMVDINSNYRWNKYCRLLLKVKNATDTVFLSPTLYESNAMVGNPQYRRNVFAGVEFDYKW